MPEERQDGESKAFAGIHEFEIAIEILGHRFTREAKAEYSYTPEWEYFDLQKRELVDGSMLDLDYTLYMLTVPAEDYPLANPKDLEEPEWVPLPGLRKIGALPMEVQDAIEDALDRRCKVEDEKRRRAAGLK
jgi:hypothetical protein